MKRSTTWTLFAAMAGLALALAALGSSGQPAKPAANVGNIASAPARAVSIAHVESRTMGGSLTASGLLVAREEAAVGPQVTGHRVAAVLADEGDVVRAGQPLARLDPSLLEARIAQARAAVEQARAQAAQAEGDAGRVEGLDGSGVLADEQIATRRLQARSAKAAVEVARAQLRDLEVQAAKLVVRAPVSGRVLQRNVRPGDIASPAAEPMFRLLRDQLVELDAELPEDALDGLAKDMKAQVQLPAGARFEARVRFVSPRVDPQTKLGRVRLALPVDERLRPGGFARATLARAARPVAAVPEAALQFEAGGPQLVTVDAQGRAKRVPVRPGAREGGWVALIEGPPAGTAVALGGGAFLLDGDRVQTVEGR
jgi:HlyD family secretion protein